MIFTCEFSFRRKSDIRIPRKPAWAVLHLPSSYRPQRRYYQRVRVYTQHRCVWQNMYLSMWGGPGEILRMMLLVLLLLLCSLSPAGQPGDPLTAWSHVPLLCPRPQGSLLTEDHPQPHSPATSLTHVPILLPNVSDKPQLRTFAQDLLQVDLNIYFSVAISWSLYLKSQPLRPHPPIHTISVLPF